MVQQFSHGIPSGSIPQGERSPEGNSYTKQRPLVGQGGISMNTYSFLRNLITQINVPYKFGIKVDDKRERMDLVIRNGVKFEVLNDIPTQSVSEGDIFKLACFMVDAVYRLK